MDQGRRAYEAHFGGAGVHLSEDWLGSWKRGSGGRWEGSGKGGFLFNCEIGGRVLIHFSIARIWQSHGRYVCLRRLRL